MNTVNYNDAEQLFGAVGTSLKKHTAEISDIVNVYGAKNLLPNIAATKTTNDITFTVYNDGSVDINGTASADAYLNLDFVAQLSDAVFDVTSLIGKSLIISIRDTAVSGISINLTYFKSDNTNTTIANNITTSRQFTYPSEAVKDRSFLKVTKNTVADHVKVYPMIRLASIEDDTYVSYAKSNKELTDDISSLAARIKAIEDTNHLTWV